MIQQNYGQFDYKPRPEIYKVHLYNEESFLIVNNEYYDSSISQKKKAIIDNLNWKLGSQLVRSIKFIRYVDEC